MRNTPEEVARAVEKLKLKIPSLNWKVSGTSGQRQKIECRVDQPVGLGEIARNSAVAAFKAFLRSNGIELDFYVSATSRGTGWITIEIRDPLIIRSLANDMFLYPPPLDSAENTYIAAILSKKTGFQWHVNDNGTVSCDAWMTGPYPNFESAVRQAGIEFIPITKENKKKWVEGRGDFVQVNAVFNPLELHAMLAEFRAQGLDPSTDSVAATPRLGELPEPIIPPPPLVLSDGEYENAAKILGQKTQKNFVVNKYKQVVHEIKMPRGTYETPGLDFSKSTADDFERMTKVKPDRVDISGTNPPRGQLPEVSRIEVVYSDLHKLRALSDEYKTVLTTPVPAPSTTRNAAAMFQVPPPVPQAEERPSVTPPQTSHAPNINRNTLQGILAEMDSVRGGDDRANSLIVIRDTIKSAVTQKSYTEAQLNHPIPPEIKKQLMDTWVNFANAFARAKDDQAYGGSGHGMATITGEVYKRFVEIFDNCIAPRSAASTDQSQTPGVGKK